MKRPHLEPRRKKLLNLLPPSTAVLLFNGDRKTRVFPASAYPFRGNSHFLYFFGRQPPKAAGLLTADGATLFLPRVTEQEAMWEGPARPWTEIASDYSLTETLPLTELEDRVGKSGERVLSLRTFDPRTDVLQAELLRREVSAHGKDRPLAEAVITLRLQHDEAALEEMIRAAEMTARAHRTIVPNIWPGQTERELAAQLAFECARHGFGMSFEPIVTVRGDILHETSCSGTLQEEDMLLVDFGAETPEGYAGDMTRTWPVGGKATPLQKELHAVVTRANQAATALVQPGVRYRDIHLAASKILAEGLVSCSLLKGNPDTIVEAGVHALFFPHGIGHLVGLDVHDMEDFGDMAGYEPGWARSTELGLNALRLDRVLKEGMIVTIEPGIYVITSLLSNDELRVKYRQFLPSSFPSELRAVRGVRIEDEVLVTAEGHRVLTRE